MSTRDTNDDGYCVIYALPGDSDLMVFNADLFDLSEGGHMAGADPDDLTAVAIVELESEVNLELWGDVPRACYRKWTATACRPVAGGFPPGRSWPETPEDPST